MEKISAKEAVDLFEEGYGNVSKFCSDYIRDLDEHISEGDISQEYLEYMRENLLDIENQSKVFDEAKEEMPLLLRVIISPSSLKAHTSLISASLKLSMAERTMKERA